MALNEQMKEAIQADIADESSKKERLAKQIEGLKSTGKFIGETAVESVPGVSEAIAAKNVSRDLKEGDYVGAGIETLAGLAGLAPAGGDALAKAIRTFKPKKTVKAYKLFTKGEDGNLYPLFVDADTPIKRGEYIQAVIPDSVFTAPNGKKYVPSKGTGKKKGTGDNIPIPDQATRDLLIEKGFLKAGSKAKSVKAVALRPGWHAGDSPAAPHIGNEYKGKKFRGEDQVWAEVEMPADVDWQSIANKRAELKKDGTPNVKTAHITDELPLGGFYRYKTNPNMQGNWLISGQMKINRVLGADEVKRLNKEAGVKDLPTLKELKAKEMAKGGAVMDDYQFAELEMEAPQKFAEGGMSKQMELFEDGGLMDEGGMVDEVSGNEVPPGSTREEVRDDIPAQLSEGEFVFPADVVRYIGLENLMRMRQEAKMGLAQMEAMGQMGNSEEATMPDDLPFDMYDLEVEDDGVQDFAQGGVVQAQAGTFVAPNLGSNIGGYQPSQFAGYTPQYTPYTPPPVPVGQQLAQQYTPAQQQAVPTITQQAPTFTGFTGMAGPGTGGYDEIKTYVNEFGLELRIPFKNGQPIYPIPEGYSLKSETDIAGTTTTGGSGVGQAISITGDDSEPKPLSPYEQEIKEVQSSKEFKEVYDLFDPRTTKEKVVDDIKGLYTTFNPVARALGLKDTKSQEFGQLKDELTRQVMREPDPAKRTELLNEVSKMGKEGLLGPFDRATKAPVEDMTTPAAREKLRKEGKLTESPKDVRDVTVETTRVTKTGKATEVIEKGIAEYAKQLGISPEEMRKQMEQSPDVAENVERIGQLVDKGATVEPVKPSAAPAETRRLGTDTYGVNDDFTISNSQAIAENRRNAGTDPYEDNDIVYTSEVYNPSTGRTETINYNVHGIGKNSRGQTTFASGKLKTDAKGKVVNAEIPGSKPSGSDSTGPDFTGSGTSSDGPDYSGNDYSDSYASGVEDYGIPGLAKGGLAKQMEKSGLTPKK